MSIPKIPCKLSRQICYLPSIAVFSLALAYCALIYWSGESADTGAGFKYLIGIPNYYFFYLTIFPFITAGIIYMATRNTNIRFFGELSSDLDIERKNKILLFRKILLAIAVVFSLVVTMNDASDKGRSLPPYALALASEQAYTKSTKEYFRQKEISSAQRKSAQENANLQYIQDNYFKALKESGFNGDSVTGFNSFSSWYYDSSRIYKMESLLSWIAAFVISIFIAQFFLTLMVKEHVVSETKNLMLWLLILCSFWIPCKIFSVYYYSLAEYQPPAIVWFAIFLLAISVVLALFIKAENNDMIKYATVAGAAFSLLATTISILKPEYFELAARIMEQLGWTYSTILLFIMAFSIYLVTDHLILSYEKGKTDSPIRISGGNSTSKSN